MNGDIAKDRIIGADKTESSIVENNVKRYCKESILQELGTKKLGRNLIFFQETDSTNLQAKQAAMAGAEDGTLVVAKKQTAGRGRRGRVWESPPVGNIYFSLLLKPDITPEAASGLTLLMAYAVQCALEKYVPCAIKWPNDIVVDGKKVCGILTELQLDGMAIHHVVVGVGINVGRRDFGAELADKAISLEEACANKEIELSRSKIIADILYIFEKEYEIYINACKDTGKMQQKLHVDNTKLFCEMRFGQDFVDQYNARLVNRDREVCVLDPKGEYRGIARGINSAGELLVELANGSVRAVYAGEVSVRGIYGYV